MCSTIKGYRVKGHEGLVLGDVDVHRAAVHRADSGALMVDVKDLLICKTCGRKISFIFGRWPLCCGKPMERIEEPVPDRPHWSEVSNQPPVQDDEE